MSKVLGLASLITTILLFGCATIVNGSSQRIQVESNVEGAKFRIAGSTYTTPASVPLKGKARHILYFENNPGYEDEIHGIKGKVRVGSGIIANIFNFSLGAGFVVDFFVTGAAWEIPSKIYVNLNEKK